MGDEREGLRPEHFDCPRADCAEQKIMFQERVGQLTQERDRWREAASGIDLVRVAAMERRITELEAALTAFCDYQQAARHPWPALDQLVRQGRAVLSTSKEETRPENAETPGTHEEPSV